MALVPIQSKDLEMILTWRNSENVRKHMYTSHVISWDEHLKWFESNQKNLKVKWFLFFEEDGEPAGVVGFTDIDNKSKSATWAFYAGPEAQRGIGMRMEVEALNHAFDELKLHKLNCEVLSTNVGVVALHKKFGFIQEGLFRDNHFNGNEFTDVVRLGILNEEWQNKKEEMFAKLASFKK